MAVSDVRALSKSFLGFAFIAGMGWILDFACFTSLVKGSSLSPVLANIISSYVGVTFVWFMSLNAVFKASGSKNHYFLILYWAFQFLSISFYSAIIHQLARLMSGIDLLALSTPDSLVVAKIMATPFNLLTNFVFMKTLTRFMKKREQA